MYEEQAFLFDSDSDVLPGSEDNFDKIGSTSEAENISEQIPHSDQI